MRRSIVFFFLIIGFLLQLSVLARTIILSQQTIAHGKVYRFATMPIDPYDAFRGRYVWLRFAVTDQTYPTDKDTCEKIKATSQAIIELSEDAKGYAKIANITTYYPENGDSFMAQASCYDSTSYNNDASLDEQTTSESPYQINIRLPFTRFYANEHQAPELEKQASDNQNLTYLSVRVSNHRAIPVGLHFLHAPEQ